MICTIIYTINEILQNKKYFYIEIYLFKLFEFNIFSKTII